MYISELSLKKFRSFEDVELTNISPTLSLLVAPNATGKTNFLEALYVVLRGKSFRSNHEECVRWGEDFFVVKAVIHTNNDTTTIAAQYHIPSKRLRIEQDRQPISPITLYASFPLVLFLPDDTFLFLRGPSGRRNFLNQTLGSSSSYLSALVQYSRILKQRNTALKTTKQVTDVDTWTSLLGEQARVVWAARESLMLSLNHHVGVAYRELFGGNQKVELTLSRGIPDGVELESALRDAWEYEQRYRYTFYGPHRDDIEVLIDGRPAKSSLSRGQMRMLVLALKLGALQFITKTTGKSPIVLLDEVFSELDGDRQEQLLATLPPSSQIFLTTTTVPGGVKKRSDVRVLDLQKLLIPPTSSRDEKPETTPSKTEEQVGEKVHV